MELKLYVMDPIGNRDQLNMAAAETLRNEYPFHLQVIPCGSLKHAEEDPSPPCPSVYLDGMPIKEYGVVTPEELKAALLRTL
jgi:hypothetical protein